MAGPQKSVLILAALAVVALAVASRESYALDPIVDTGVSELAPDGRHVAVHVPGLFSMVLDTRGPPRSHKGVRLTQNVLSGLVRVFIDRAQGPDGRTMVGPIEVKVFGMTVYNNKAAPLSSVPSLPTLPTLPSLTETPAVV